jgi:hypothetical protein
MKNITILLLLICINNSMLAQTFSNTTVAACNTWDSGNTYTGFQRTIAVSGLSNPLSSSGKVLKQVNLQLGSPACLGNLSTYYARLISPSGTIIQLFGPFYFNFNLTMVKY